jgi:hypothetical protein
MLGFLLAGLRSTLTGIRVDDAGVGSSAERGSRRDSSAKSEVEAGTRSTRSHRSTCSVDLGWRPCDLIVRIRRSAVDCFVHKVGWDADYVVAHDMETVDLAQ